MLRQPSRPPLLRLLACLAVSAVAVAACTAQELTNHALGKRCSVEPAPVQRYADANGPEPFVEHQFYLGELTDGEKGPSNYRAGEWVGWRDTSYHDPVRVTVDLEQPTWVDRLEVTTCGGGASIEPPQRIDVWVRSPQFPYETFVQVGQMVSEEPYAPGPGKVYRFALDACGWTADQIRLDFQERTWQYLFVDEIRVLGGDAGTQAILPIQDVSLEGELGEARGVKNTEMEGATGTAAELTRQGDSLRFSVPLPAGDYTVRVRSMATQPDTFSELLPTCGDTPMRAQCVTNNVFTWQRSHFTHPAGGTADLTFTLTEGNGVYIDQVRVHSLTLNEPLTELRSFAQDTQLAVDGKARCLVVTDDAQQLAAAANRLADAIAKRCGTRPPLKSGTQVEEGDFRQRNVLALGDTVSNLAILKASPNAWNHLPRAPEDGSAQVYVAVDPKGAGWNVVVLGGADVTQVNRSVDEFLKRLTGDRTLTLPYTHLPNPTLTADRDQYKELAVESSKWIRQGAIRQLENRWKAFTDDIFLLLGYRYIEYKDSPDTIKQVSRDGFIEAELFKILCRFDRAEHNGAIPALERLQLTNTLLGMARQCAGIFDWECASGRQEGYHTPEQIDAILAERPPTIANNHQTFPAYTMLTAGDYFAKYYDLPEAKRWLKWTDDFMRGQLLTSKPQCDCWGYQDITMTHTVRHAVATNRWNYLESDPLHQFLRLRFISHDNLGSGVGYGDVGAYRPPLGPDFRASNATNWTNACAGRLDLDRVKADDVLGVYVHPLEPLWHDLNGKNGQVPLERCFDKISFRSAIDPQQAYLLLDGLSRGYHGHWDGNSILRFTDNGRMWLCEGDYLKGDPKDHNTMTFMRNAESARPGWFSSLESRFDSPQWGATCTRTPDYCGLDWDRHLLWFKPADLFFLIDEMTAKQPGAYDMTCRFRSLGDTTLDGRTWTVTQKGAERFFLHAPGTGRLSEASDPDDAKNWEAYEFADPTPKLLNHHVAREMKPGDRAALCHAFYAGVDSQGKPKLAVTRVSDTAMVVSGYLDAIVGVHDFREVDLTVKADQFVVSEVQLLLVNATELITPDSRFAADHPVSLSFDVKRGTGVLETDAETRLTLPVGWSGRAQVAEQAIATDPYTGVHLTVPAGRHELRGNLFQGLSQGLNETWRRAQQAQTSDPPTRPDHGLAPAFSFSLPAEITTLTAGDLDGDGTDEFLAGCADGTVAAVDASDAELWHHTFGARVNDLATVDLDGDGKAEVACGVEDEHLHLLNADGKERWKHYFEAYRSDGGKEGHVRVVLPADFDGDGTSEIAVGCANTKFYVLNADGTVRESKGQPWVVSTKHSASALGAADVTGDGQLELFGGYTYFGRALVDFADTGKSRVSNLGGCISGCGSITSADVDGDGKPEALFADRDGQLTACRKARPGERTVDIVWQKIIGDDAISKVLADDLDGDGKPEIVIASHSGFVVLLDAAGAVQWLQHARNQVTDAALLDLPNGSRGIARTAADGSVVVYGRDGGEKARWSLGTAVSQIVAPSAMATSSLAVAAGRTLHAAVLSR